MFAARCVAGAPRVAALTAALLLLLLVHSALLGTASAHAVRPEKRDYKRLPDSSLAALAQLAEPAPLINHQDPSSLLSRILIPRAPDTDNSTLVREYILDVFRTRLAADATSGKLGWQIDTPTFVAKTPEGPKKMTNIVLTKNPAAPRKLVLAAHYDSKFFPQASGMSGFVGATDSAAPCAILVEVAAALDDALDRRERRIHNQKPNKPLTRSEETTLQIVLFDGEEAYRQWTSTDSIYGSRELAKNWTTHYWSPSDYLESASHGVRLTARRFHSTYTPVRHMDTIEHLVLLDLLGAPNPSVPSYFKPTEWLHAELMDAEKRLRQAGVLFPAGAKGETRSSFFNAHPALGGIEDDHLPFLHAGVAVLHVIPNPFPRVWHKLSDDRTALDYPTVYAWSMIMRLFTVEYLELDIQVKV
ncbi:hypothetical protein ACQY0O_000168 [Thecaphora frezii]